MSVFAGRAWPYRVVNLRVEVAIRQVGGRLMDPDDLESTEDEQRGGQAERDRVGTGRSAGEPGSAEDP